MMESSDEESSFTGNVVLEVPSWAADRSGAWGGTMYFWWLYLVPEASLVGLFVALFLKELTVRTTTIMLQGPFVLAVSCYMVSSHELRMLQGKGYLRLYRSTSYLLRILPLVLAVGNSVILGLWCWVPSPLEKNHEYLLTGPVIMQIIIGSEALILFPCMLLFLMRCVKHIHKKAPPDLHAESISNIKGGLFGSQPSPIDISSHSAVQSNEDFVSYFEDQETRIEVLTKEILSLKDQLAKKA